MSEWTTNTGIREKAPEHLLGTVVEVMYNNGEVHKDRAEWWDVSWNTSSRYYIAKYRVIKDAEQKPTASDMQVGGTHYLSLSIQPWDAMESWLTPEQFRGYLLGSAIKYLGRYNADATNKGGMVDVKKAIQFLNKLVEFGEKGGD